MKPSPSLPPSLTELLPHLTSKIPVWLVGGGVRDHLLGRSTLDFDFAVDGDAIRLARSVADRMGGAYYDLDKDRGTGRVIIKSKVGDRWTLDFARLRGTNITADLRARDFTINAMAISLDKPHAWLDPLGGVKDLQAKTLRACSSHAIADDSIRALRAVRLAIKFNYKMAPDTLNQVRNAGGKLVLASMERIRDEILLVLDTPKPGRAIRLLDHFGLLELVFPELEPLRDLKQPPPHSHLALEHTFAVIDRLGDLLAVLDLKHQADAAANLILAQAVGRLGRFREKLCDHLSRVISPGRRSRQLLFFAALYHNSGRSARETISTTNGFQFPDFGIVSAELIAGRAESLRLSKTEVRYVEKIVRYLYSPELHPSPLPPSPRAIYRFFRPVGDSGVEIVLLYLADFLGKYTPPAPQSGWEGRVEIAHALLEAYFEDKETRIHPRILIRGDDLIHTLDLEPGPEIGRLLEIIREAQVAGEVTTKDEALSLARDSVSKEEGIRNSKN